MNYLEKEYGWWKLHFIGAMDVSPKLYSHLFHLDEFKTDEALLQAITGYEKQGLKVCSPNYGDCHYEDGECEAGVAKFKEHMGVAEPSLAEKKKALQDELAEVEENLVKEAISDKVGKFWQHPIAKGPVIAVLGHRNYFNGKTTVQYAKLERGYFDVRHCGGNFEASVEDMDAMLSGFAEVGRDDFVNPLRACKTIIERMIETFDVLVKCDSCDADAVCTGNRYIRNGEDFKGVPLCDDHCAHDDVCDII